MASCCWATLRPDMAASTATSAVIIAIKMLRWARLSNASDRCRLSSSVRWGGAHGYSLQGVLMGGTYETKLYRCVCMSTTSLTNTLEQDPRLVRSRAKVLAAATELLIESGPRGITVDAVAERSGVAKSTLYRHWSSVQELLVDVMRCNVPAATAIDLSRRLPRRAAAHGSIRASPRCPLPAGRARCRPCWSCARHSPEMAEVLNADFDAKLHLIASILELGASGGSRPRRPRPTPRHADPRRPARARRAQRRRPPPRLADFVLERFLDSYRS